MMDEILEGDVGRTVKFEGKEYWIKEPEPVNLEHIQLLREKIDRQRYQPDYYYSFLSKFKFNLLQGITEV